MVNRETYKQWLDNAVTKEFATSIYESAADLLEVLQSQENTRDQDRFIKGFLRAIKSLQDWQPEIEEEVKNATEDQGSRTQSYS